MARRTTYGQGVSKFREASYIQGEFNCKEDRELSNKARRRQLPQGVYIIIAKRTIYVQGVSKFREASYV